MKTGVPTFEKLSRLAGAGRPGDQPVPVGVFEQQGLRGGVTLATAAEKNPRGVAHSPSLPWLAEGSPANMFWLIL
jgi:hypothetical protein